MTVPLPCQVCSSIYSSYMSLEQIQSHLYVRKITSRNENYFQARVGRMFLYSYILSSRNSVLYDLEFQSHDLCASFKL